VKQVDPLESATSVAELLDQQPTYGRLLVMKVLVIAINNSLPESNRTELREFIDFINERQLDASREQIEQTKAALARLGVVETNEKGGFSLGWHGSTAFKTMMVCRAMIEGAPNAKELLAELDELGTAQ
jgi:hypothetical protein